MDLATLSKAARFHESIFGTYLSLATAGYGSRVLAQLLENLGPDWSDRVKGLKELGPALNAISLRVACPGGLLGEIESIISPSFAGYKDPAIHQLVRLQSLVMIGSYLTEHGAWISRVAPNLTRINTAFCERWSCYFWLGWILVGAIAHALRFRELKSLRRTCYQPEVNFKNMTVLCLHSTHAFSLV